MKKGTRKIIKNDQLELLQKQVAEINNAIGCNKIKVELGEYNFFEVIYGDKKYVGGYYDAEKFLSFVIIGVELKATSNDELYREQEFEYRKQDAENHAEEMGVDGILTEEDYYEIAQRFLNKQDCNIDENTQFEYIINEYLLIRKG